MSKVERNEPATVSTERSAPPLTAPGRHLPILDGWRAVSILLVMAGHFLPIGPSSWLLNGAFAALGMAIFFTLSGFLITSFLLAKPDIIDFLLRRLFRIIPLAWLAMLILIVVNMANTTEVAANLLFFANLPPTQLLPGGEHLWSLCVEMQFYVGVAIVVGVLGQRGLYLLPLLAVAITAIRIANSAEFSIYTYERLDEILAGATLALFFHRFPRLSPPAYLTLALVPLGLLASHESSGFLCYLRPYVVASMVGFSIYASPAPMQRLFASRAAAYVAAISYGLYVAHAMLAATWLGSGSTVVKYLKRPLLIGLTFLVADLSFRFYERPMQKLGKRIRRGDAAALPKAVA